MDGDGRMIYLEKTLYGRLVRVTAHRLDEGIHVLITGGDTLMECMKRLGVTEMEPVGELSAGVVYSRFRFGSAVCGVISKSGGFGGETLLSDLKTTIEQGR